MDTTRDSLVYQDGKHHIVQDSFARFRAASRANNDWLVKPYPRQGSAERRSKDQEDLGPDTQVQRRHHQDIGSPCRDRQAPPGRIGILVSVISFTRPGVIISPGCALGIPL